ncbi:MAG: DNA-directed RNA polymerase subunit omega [Clostridia bacterium]|nr:DNA-directed RNA polymerase subunit omega [Clostridia bacterium]
MITKPSIDSLTKIAGNKYLLCCAIAKRAKDLNMKIANDEIEIKGKTISYAAQELADHKIKIIEEE